MRTGLLLLAVCALAGGAAPAAVSATTLGGEVYGAFNTFAMNDLNQGVHAWNDQLQARGLPSTLADLSSGFTMGVGVRAWLRPTWMVRAGWEPILAETEDLQQTTIPIGIINYLATTHARSNADANDFSLTVGYFMPSKGSSRFGFGAGADYVRMLGRAERSLEITPPPPPPDPSASTRADLTGSTVGFHLQGLGEWTVSPGFSVTGVLGYRYAKVSDTQFNGQSQSPKIETDYSGVTARLGLALYLPSHGK